LKKENLLKSKNSTRLTQIKRTLTTIKILTILLNFLSKQTEPHFKTKIKNPFQLY